MYWCIQLKVIQNRNSGSTMFYTDWAQYKNGFGIISSDFWIGKTHVLPVFDFKFAIMALDIYLSVLVVTYCTDTCVLVKPTMNKHKLQNCLITISDCKLLSNDIQSYIN